VSRLVLASTSAIRRTLLEAAGLAVTVEAPAVDEAAIKAALLAKGADAPTVAAALAERKALSVAGGPDAYVIGADQMLECYGRWFDKPGDLAGARRQLEALRGREHHLYSAVAVASGGVVLWRRVERARLVMRAFSDAFLDSYLERAGAAALWSVGSYQLEGLGVQLFSEIEGDHFTILGLPLLPLLAFLRSRGVLSA
jgi:septum formation protein